MTTPTAQPTVLLESPSPEAGDAELGALVSVHTARLWWPIAWSLGGLAFIAVLTRAWLDGAPGIPLGIAFVVLFTVGPIYWRWRRFPRRIALHEQGFVYERGPHRLVWRWEDVREVAWNVRRTGGIPIKRYRVVHRDGASVMFDAYLRDFARLGDAMLEQVYRGRFPAAWNARGEEVAWPSPEGRRWLSVRSGSVRSG